MEDAHRVEHHGKPSCRASCLNGMGEQTQHQASDLPYAPYNRCYLPYRQRVDDLCACRHLPALYPPDKPYWRLFALELLYLIHQLIINGFVLLLNINCLGSFIAETCAMLVITFFYNGKKGHFPKFSKWIFYVFYPAHLIVAILINTFVF